MLRDPMGGAPLLTFWYAGEGVKARRRMKTASPAAVCAGHEAFNTTQHATHNFFYVFSYWFFLKFFLE